MKLLSRVPPSVVLTFFFETVYLIVLAATDGYDAARTGEVRRIVLTYGVLGALFWLGDLLFPTRRGRLAVAVTLFSIFCIVNFARFETAGVFDYGFLHENVRELMTPLGRHIVGSRVRAHEVLLLLVLPIACGVWFLRRNVGDAPIRWRRRTRGAWALACLAVLFGLPVFHVTTHESVTGFAASAFRYYSQARTAEAAIGGAGGYPLVYDFVPSAEGRAAAGEPAPRPHVILLFLESWSGIYSDARQPDGTPYTPVFDERRTTGLSFDHFYGNSIQSSRGRFATLCSLIPMFRGKEFNDLSRAPLHCLPKVLSEAGYLSVIDSASDEPQFERSEEFFAHLGFDEVRFEDPERRGTEPGIWGAGLQDDLFYRAFFQRLDAKVAADPDRPLFAVGINASNHYPFDQDPGHVPATGPKSKYGKNYVASLHAQDARLASFFEELDKRPAFRDGIVVLVGDHSFPADEHGIHFNGLGAYEETFKTVMMLRWNGHVAPRVDHHATASQLDLAPTITDLLQLSHPSHFAGRSLLVAGGEPRAVPLVQPYDGIRLVATRWPFKLQRHEGSEQDHLYDLSKDPDEDVDRVDDPALRPVLEELRATIARMRKSQAVLKANRVFPASSAERSAP